MFGSWWMLSICPQKETIESGRVWSAPVSLHFIILSSTRRYYLSYQYGIFFPLLQVIALLAKSVIIVVYYIVVCREKAISKHHHTLVSAPWFFLVPTSLYAFIVFFQGKKRGEGESWHVLQNDRRERKYRVEWNQLLSKYPPVMGSGMKGKRRQWPDILFHPLSIPPSP